MRFDRIGSKGVGFALAAALLFGASAPAAKGLLRGTAPQLLAGLLYLGSGGGLLLYWLSPRRSRERAEAPLGIADIPWLASAIVAGGVVAPLLLMVGLTRTPASAASLLLNLERRARSARRIRGCPGAGSTPSTQPGARRALLARDSGSVVMEKPRHTW